MLELDDVTLSYDDQPLLNKLRLCFKPGELTVLAGTSGSGKSSLLRLLNGIIPEFQKATVSGRLSYKGQDLLALNMAERSQFLSTVFQNPKTQFYATNSTDELAFALENRNLPREEILQRIAHYSQLFGTEKLLDRNVFSLSGGEKQLLAITSVVCMDNDVYLFDEPSASLDRAAIEHLKAVLIKLKELGKTVIIAEHRLYYLRDIMDQFVLLENQTAQAYSAEALDQDFVRAHELRQLDKIQKQDLLSSSYQVKSMFDKGGQPAGLLQLQDYRYSYGSQPVFDMKQAFEPGIHFIIGANGVGKTTFLRALCGLLKRFKGRAFYQDKPLRPSCDWISLVMQDVNYQLFTESVWSEISIVSDDDQAKEQALMEQGLLDKKERHPQSLSGGEKQRLLLAMAKVSDKPVLILDEPTSGLCKAQMERMAQDLHRLAGQGKLILIVTHDYELIQTCGGQIIEFVK